MGLRNKGLVLAMEDDSFEGIGSDDTVGALGEVEAGASEIQEDGGEIEDINTAIEDAAEDTETLGDIQDIMADSVESGEGLDETSAEIAEVAVEAICARLGIRGSRTMPATESFGSSNSRVAATKIAMEGIGDRIKTIWQAIEKAFISMWTKIKEFFAKFFTNTEKIKKAAAALKEKAKGFKDATIKEAAIKSGFVAGAFNEDGTANLNTAKAILGNHVALTEAALKAKDVIVELAKVVESSVTSKDPASFDKKVAEDAVYFIKAFGSSLKVTSETKGDAKVVTGKSGAFVGGTMCVAEVSISEDSVTLSFKQEDSGKKAPESLPTLKHGEILSLLDEVTKLATVTEDYKKNQAKFDAINKSLIAVAHSVINSADKIASLSEENAATKKAISQARTVVTSLNSVVTRITTMVPVANVRACKAALNYADLSLKAHEAKKEEKAK